MDEAKKVAVTGEEVIAEYLENRRPAEIRQVPCAARHGHTVHCSEQVLTGRRQLAVDRGMDKKGLKKNLVEKLQKVLATDPKFISAVKEQSAPGMENEGKVRRAAPRRHSVCKRQ